MSDVANRLKHLFSKNGVTRTTQQTASKKINVHPITFNRICNGQQALSLEGFKKICDVYQIRSEWLLWGEGDIFQEEALLYENDCRYENLKGEILILKNHINNLSI